MQRLPDADLFARADRFGCRRHIKRRERRSGLPIGNLTSQFFANVYVNGMDHFCKGLLHAAGYVRYIDVALFHDDPVLLEAWRQCIAATLKVVTCRETTCDASATACAAALASWQQP